MTHTKIDELKAELDQVLDRRNTLFPVRDEQNTREMNRLLDEFSFLTIQKAQGTSPNLDSIAIKNISAMIDSPVVICGYPKSGTTLLCSLLDGHSSLVVLPGDARMRDWFDSTETHSTRDSETHWIHYLVNPRGQRPYWFLGEDWQPYINFIKYYRYFSAKAPHQEVNQYLNGLRSFYCTNPHRCPHPQLWVEKTPLNELFADGFLSLFPSTLFIHIVRNPFANIASMKRLYRSRSSTTYRRLRYYFNEYSTRFCRINAKSLRQSMQAAIDNQKKFGEKKYLIISYESLTINLEEQSRKITDFLGIPWEDSLMRPTNNGLPVVANSMYTSRQVEGIVLKDNSDYWMQELSTLETKTITAILREISATFGYKMD